MDGTTHGDASDSHVQVQQQPYEFAPLVETRASG